MHLRSVPLALLIGAVACVSPRGVWADEPAAGTEEAAAAQAEFEKGVADWKKVIAELRDLQLQYKVAKPADRKALEAKFDEIRERGIALEPPLKKLAETAYVAAPNKNKEITDFMVSMAMDAAKKDNYEEALRIADLLIKNDFDQKAIYNLAGVAAFNLGDFERAEKDLKIAQENNALDEQVGQRYVTMLDDYKKKWQREAQLREAENKADDLPRVRLKTTQGDIVIELFENEAPNAVANFISLVSKGFYNGLAFHRVLPGFMAQGGDPKGDGTGGPGYTIACECEQENHREHFRGSLSMAHLGKDTGGSQFFLTFVPTPHLDGKHTVFGRVIEGFDVLSKLKRRDPSQPRQPDPDKIISATIIRKRAHAYEPKTQPDKG